jgi:hypothetical protein
MLQAGEMAIDLPVLETSMMVRPVGIEPTTLSLEG